MRTKIMLICGLLLALAHKSIGQTEKGGFSLGFNANFNFEDHIIDEGLFYTAKLGLSPEYFLTKHWTVGLLGGIDFRNSRIGGRGKSYVYGPYTKYYFAAPGIFLRAGYQVAEFSGRDITLAAGYAFFVDRKLFIEPFIEYGLETYDDNLPDYVTAGLAVRIYFKRKQ